MSSECRLRVSIDIGGTFTDCVLRDQSGRFVLEKAFTTPGNLVLGVLRSLENAASHWGLSVDRVLADTALMKVGTTSCINRLINRAGAKTALITTRGHEDALFIGRVQQKTDGLSEVARRDLRAWSKADAIVPRDRIFGIDERVNSKGRVLCVLDEQAVERAVRACLAQDVVSFAVCFLWSFVNPTHEQGVRRVIQRLTPDAFVVLSSEIAPLLGEYERAATTVLNSYLGPGTADDLASLEGALRHRGLRSTVFIMQSSGGVLEASKAFRRPVHMLGSGPVGGVAAARDLSRRFDGANVIATDMGGTSFDVGVIVGGRPIEERVPVHNRYRVFVSALEVTSIGAGGGSIAFVDPVTGVLQVGPASAGAMPGPVCYGFGGAEPTVTDANAVLGRLNPARFFAGRRELDVQAAREAISTKIAEPLQTSVEEAAAGIVEIVDNRMADLVRNLTIQRGLDPRDFTVVAYGGGAPLHVGRYGREIGVRRAVIPRAAPVYSAWGIADSPVLQTFAVSASVSLPTPTESLRTAFDQLTQRLASQSARSGSHDLGATQSLFVDMRYRFQRSELAVPIETADLSRPDLSEVLMERFERLYEERYGAGTTFRDAGIEISSFRLLHSQSFRQDASPVWNGAGTDRPTHKRSVWFDGSLLSVPVYEAGGTSVEFHALGPCILEGDLITIVVHPGQSVTVDDRGDFLLETDLGD